YFIFIPPSATDIYALSLHDALPISPLGGVYAREVADLAEASVAAVQLQGVPGVLGMVTELLAQLEGPEALRVGGGLENLLAGGQDRKSTRLNSSHVKISYAVFCLKK